MLSQIVRDFLYLKVSALSIKESKIDLSDMQALTTRD